jgi:ribosomal protein S18 acetylase RimI-like enzyme
VNLVIRPFTPDDILEALELWRRSEGIGMRGVADTEAGTRRYLERNPGGSFVARDGVTLVGAVLCGHDARRGYLHHLAVATSHRRRGIGRALMRECLARLASEGIDRCHLFVRAGNAAAERFWMHEGWSRRDDIVMMSHDLPLRAEPPIPPTPRA